MYENGLQREGFQNLWYYSLRMHAFSYTWSLQSHDKEGSHTI